MTSNKNTPIYVFTYLSKTKPVVKLEVAADTRAQAEARVREFIDRKRFLLSQVWAPIGLHGAST